MSNRKLITQLDVVATSMLNERDEKGLSDLYRDLKDFIAPDRGRNLQMRDTSYEVDRDSKQFRTQLIDDTPEKAVMFFAAMFSSFLTPRTRTWFRLFVGDSNMMRRQDVRIWLDDVREVIADIMSDTNFYDNANNVYIEIALFATAAMAILEDEVDTIYTRAYTMGEYAVATNSKGEVDTFLRTLWPTARQMADLFGEENMSKAAMTALKDPSTANKTRFQVFQLIEPLDGRRNLKLPPIAAEFPFVSIYWEKGGSTTLSLSGFLEFPILTPRWNVIADDSYGRESPGMRQLATAKALHVMHEDMLIASKKLIDPPMVTDVQGQQIDHNAGGITYTPSITGGQPSINNLYDGYRPDLNASLQMVDLYQNLIRQGFFNDLFFTVTEAERDRKTATEVVALQEEKFAALGPVLNRLNREFLGKSIERIYNIALRQGLIPEPPEILQGGVFEIEYTSILAQAAKAVDSNAIDQYLVRIGNLSEFYPEALRKIDPLAVVDEYALNAGIPGRITVDTDDALALIEQDAEQQRQAEAMQMAEQGGKAANNLSNADLSGDTALTALMSGELASP